MSLTEPALAADPARDLGGRLRLFYFLYYAGVGVTLPYFTLYLQGLGLSGAEIGAVQMVQPLCAAPAGLFWAATADRLNATRRALALSAILVAAAYALLLTVHGAWGVAAVMLALGLGGPALVPLVDAIAVEWSRAQPGASYPRTRLFGSLGYVVAAQGLGLLLGFRGSKPADPAVPWSLFLTAVGFAAVALGLPEPPSAEHPLPPGALGAVLRQRRLLWLLAMCALHWMLCAPYNLFFGPFVRDHGLPDPAIGLASGLGVATEVAVLWFAPTLERRFSARALFAFSFAITGVRWGLLSVSAGGLAVVGLQALHGTTFGLFWATAVRAMREIVPGPLRATGQAVFGAVVFQLGSALANPLAGWAFDRAGHAAPLYAGAAVLELAPLLLALRFG